MKALLRIYIYLLIGRRAFLIPSDRLRDARNAFDVSWSYWRFSRLHPGYRIHKLIGKGILPKDSLKPEELVETNITYIKNYITRYKPTPEYVVKVLDHLHRLKYMELLISDPEFIKRYTSGRTSSIMRHDMYGMIEHYFLVINNELELFVYIRSVLNGIYK